VFRRLAGITPKHYREMHRAGTHGQHEVEAGKAATAA
jgi:hypothetical protein